MKSPAVARFNQTARCYMFVWVLSAVTGCMTVGPNYTPPEISMPAKWNNPAENTQFTSDSDISSLAEWWKVFGDNRLNFLIERSVKGNLDIKLARSRVTEARARLGLSQTDLIPKLDASASAISSRSSENMGTGKTSEMYTTSIDTSWEIDIFGGVRRSIEASTADLQAVQENLRDVLVSLLSEVALNYTNVRMLQNRLAVMEETLKTQTDTYQLTLWRYEAGLCDELTVQQAQYSLENTRAQMPSLQTGIEEAMNRIAVLSGESPGSVRTELQTQDPIPGTSKSIITGIPADLLRRRPDIRKTERELAAQTARIGVATAELYPKIKLNGSIGFEAFSLGKLFSSCSETSNGNALISWPIFNAGSIRRNIQVQSALQEQALIAYEKSVLQAVEEVENALSAYSMEQERLQALTSATHAAQRAADLVQKKYQTGLADFRDVLETQRSRLSFQDQLVQSEGSITLNLIHLYKALGGGWTSIVPEG